MGKRHEMNLIDLLFSLGIIVSSVGIMIYMFVADAFSIGIFLALIIFLYSGIANLMEERSNLKNRHS